jgi:hypothetical protein
LPQQAIDFPFQYQFVDCGYQKNRIGTIHGPTAWTRSGGHFIARSRFKQGDLVWQPLNASFHR